MCAHSVRLICKMSSYETLADTLPALYDRNTRQMLLLEPDALLRYEKYDYCTRLAAARASIEGPHHDGESETGIYVVAGHPEFIYSEGGEPPGALERLA